MLVVKLVLDVKGLLRSSSEQELVLARTKLSEASDRAAKLTHRSSSNLLAVAAQVSEEVDGAIEAAQSARARNSSAGAAELGLALARLNGGRRANGRS